MIDRANKTSIPHYVTSVQRQLPIAGWTLGLVTLIVTILIFHLWTLRHYPPAFVDEAWMASRAWAWLNTGLNVGPLDGIVFSKLDGYWTVPPLLATLLHATTIRLFGLSVTSLRLVSLLFGMGLLVAVYFISRECRLSRRGSLISVLLVATSYPFLSSAHLVRPDIFVAALCYTAIALYLVGRSRQHPLIFSLSAGMLIAVAFEIHPNAAVFGPVIVALYFVDDGWRFVQRRCFWAFVGGTCIGLAGYVWLHVLPNPQTYFAVMMSAYQSTHTPPVASGHLTAILDSLLGLERYLRLGTFTRIFGTLVAALLLWYESATRRTRPLAMLIVSIVTFSLLVKRRPPYYLILIIPFADIVLSAWIDQGLRTSRKSAFWWLKGEESRIFSEIAASLSRFLGKALVYAFIIASLILGLSSVLGTPPPGDLGLVANHIKQVTPEGGLVMAPHIYWFRLHQYPYRTWQQIRAYRRWNPGSTLDDAMRAMRPDIFVIDGQSRKFIVDDEPDVPQWIRERSLPKQEVDTFLARRGKLEDRFETATHGTIEIFSIHWDDS